MEVFFRIHIKLIDGKIIQIETGEMFLHFCQLYLHVLIHVGEIVYLVGTKRDGLGVTTEGVF